MLTIETHPLLDVRAFTSTFATPLAEAHSPNALLDLLRLEAAAPLHSDDEVRKSVRDLLRVGGYKPTGRGKPASEYLLGAAGEGAMPRINVAVDACNAVSLHSGLPISVVDLDRARAPFSIAIASAGTSYVFNVSGQSIDVSGLVCLCDADGPCANAVKDAQRTKTDGSTKRTLSIVWGTRALPGRAEAASRWYRELLTAAGVRCEEVRASMTPAPSSGIPMSMMRTLVCSFVIVGCMTASARAGTTTESFTSASNAAGWVIGGADQIVSTGGNPGWFLRNLNIDTYAPQPRSSFGVTSAFTGDYRARRVTSVGIDLITIATQFPFQREVTLILDNDNGTPADPNDDCSVYFLSPGFVPQPGQGWGSFDIAVPSQSATLPAGWAVLGPCGSNDATWNSVITNVSRVHWFYGDPTFFFIFDVWQIGIDNPRIAQDLGTASCFGDGSGTPCPCGNASAAPTGCANSTGVGGHLDATGSSSVGANDLVFTATQIPATTSALLFQGTLLVNGGAGAVFGDGLRCATNSVRRLGTTAAVAGTATFGPGLAAAGLWSAGQTRHFQVWYRNLIGPCGSGHNLTDARTITFLL